MLDHCPKCGKEFEPGDVKCPSCGAELPEPADPAPPQKFAVLAATFLPVFGVLIFLVFAGAVVLGGLFYSRKLAPHHTAHLTPLPNLPPETLVSPPVQTMAVPPDAPLPPVASAPPPPQQSKTSDVAPPPVPQPQPAPPVVTEVPSPNIISFPPPSLTGFTPAIAAPGQLLTLHGDNLDKTFAVVLYDSRGALRRPAQIVNKGEHDVTVTIPQIPFADDGIYPAVFTPGGIAVLVEEHLGNTPWGTDGHLRRTAVNVRSGDEIVTLDHMLIFAMSGSTVSMGDNCVAFLSDHVTLKSVGKNCMINYVDPIEKPDAVFNSKLMKRPAIELDVNGDPFRVKPAPSGSEN